MDLLIVCNSISISTTFLNDLKEQFSTPSESKFSKWFLKFQLLLFSFIAL